MGQKIFFLWMPRGEKCIKSTESNQKTWVFSLNDMLQAFILTLKWGACCPKLIWIQDKKYVIFIKTTDLLYNYSPGSLQEHTQLMHVSTNPLDQIRFLYTHCGVSKHAELQVCSLCALLRWIMESQNLQFASCGLFNYTHTRCRPQNCISYVTDMCHFSMQVCARKLFSNGKTNIIGAGNIREICFLCEGGV